MLKSQYPWAQNPYKEERAIKEVRGDSQTNGAVGNNPVTEEAVLRVYRRLAGHVLEEFVPKEVGEQAPALPEPKPINTAPKKPGRKPKNEVAG